MELFDGIREPNLDIRKRKLTFLFLLLILIFVSRLFYYQVIRHGYYSKLAFFNRIQRERVLAPRGLIKDRNGEKLVGNMPVYQIDILPLKINNKKERLKLACKLLGVDGEGLERDINEWLKKYPDGREMTVVQSADKKQISVLRENRFLFPFFKLVMKPRRFYPKGELAAHVLGYVGEVTEGEIEREKSLHRGDIIGRTGVELQYDRYLKGIDGARVVEVSADGNTLGEIDVDENSAEYGGIASPKVPIPGCDLILTIDSGLQGIVEESFDWERGAVVAMDPATGAVLAMMSRPVYDPNIFLRGISGVEWNKLNNDPSKPLFDRAIQALYPPGSVFKLITAYAALSDGLVSMGQRLKPCLGTYKFGNRYFGCWKENGHGALNMHDAIVQSCDIYFYQLGERLSVDQFARAGHDFGLGKKTGVDLPGEARGNIPGHRYFDKKYGKRKWTKGHLLNYSIGQGEVLVTPIQLCSMASVFANGGKMVHPHVVKEIVDANGKVVYKAYEKPSMIDGLDKRSLLAVRRAMIDVVEGEKGTGRAARVPGLVVAGKTGTAQNPHGKDHAIFVCFAPADRPRIVLAIVMENAGHGGSAAAPVAGRILARYFMSLASVEERE